VVIKTILKTVFQKRKWDSQLLFWAADKGKWNFSVHADWVAVAWFLGHSVSKSRRAPQVSIRRKKQRQPAHSFGYHLLLCHFFFWKVF